MANLKKAPPKLAAGRHKTRLDRVVAETHAQWGPGLRWFFAIDDGSESWQWTGLDWVPGNSLDKLLKQLTGEEAATGSEIDPQDFVDQQFEVVVDRDGRIASIKPLAE